MILKLYMHERIKDSPDGRAGEILYSYMRKIKGWRCLGPVPQEIPDSGTVGNTLWYPPFGTPYYD